MVVKKFLHIWDLASKIRGFVIHLLVFVYIPWIITSQSALGEARKAKGIPKKFKYIPQLYQTLTLIKNLGTNFRLTFFVALGFDLLNLNAQYFTQDVGAIHNVFLCLGW
jgi:hypothetical protein